MTETSPWIRSKSYDLTFIMGGAFLTLMVPLMVGLRPTLLPLLFWAWLIFFEGSHFWATFSRTYIDTAFRKANPNVLVGSLVFFIFPVICVLYDRSATGNMAVDLYGFFIFMWSLFHNARQHYGFVSIYNKKSGNPERIQKLYRSIIYFAVCSAQIYFVLNHRAKLTFPSFPSPAEMSAPVALLAHWAPIAVSALAGVALIVVGWQSFVSEGFKGTVPAVYTAVCLIFYSLMFYFVAPREPFFSTHMNNAQLFMCIAIMNSLFHNIQYHAIVWHYGQKRYATRDTKQSTADADYGISRLVHSKMNYGLVALFFGAVFGAIVWFGGDWPSVNGTYQAAPFSPLMYCLYFGIVGHHFYLDQKIWRPSRQKELSTYLDLNASMNALNAST